MVSKTILLGHVGADPEIREFDAGNKVANLSLATTEKWKDRTTGEIKNETEWHRLVVWGSLVDIFELYVKKGSKIYIEGKNKTESWEDENGQKRYVTKVNVKVMTMLDSKGDDQGEPPAATSAPSTAPANDGGNVSSSEVDDLPF